LRLPAPRPLGIAAAPGLAALTPGPAELLDAAAAAARTLEAAVGLMAPAATTQCLRQPAAALSKDRRVVLPGVLRQMQKLFLPPTEVTAAAGAVTDSKGVEAAATAAAARAAKIQAGAAADGRFPAPMKA